MDRSNREKFADCYRIYNDDTPLLGQLLMMYHGCDLFDVDVRRLLEANRIRPIDFHDVRGTVITFSVLESAKNRRRWIVYPKEHNERYALTDSMRITLEPIEHTIISSLGSEVASTIDVDACFQQYNIASSAQPFFCFCFGAQWFCCVTIPTGGRHPPSIAQLGTMALTNGVYGVAITCHIDNIRLCGLRSDVLRAEKQVLSNALFVGMQITIERSAVMSYNFLGVSFLHISAAEVQVHLAARSATKLSEAVVSKTSTIREVLSFFGRCVYGSGVYALNKYPYYWVYKFLRRRVGCPLDSQANIWSGALSDLSHWRRTIINHSPRRVLPCSKLHTDAVLFTDASLSGWGAVAFTSSGVRIAAGHWHQNVRVEHINVLELRALANAFDSFDFTEMVDVFVDNTTVLYSVMKTRSNNFLCNNIIGHLPLHRIKSIRYVKSVDNIADPFSRI